MCVWDALDLIIDDDGVCVRWLWPWLWLVVAGCVRVILRFFLAGISLARVRNFSFEYAESYSIIIISFEVRWRQMTRVPMADHPQDYLVHT